MAYRFVAYGTAYPGIRVGISQESSTDAEFAAEEMPVEDAAQLALEILRAVAEKGYDLVAQKRGD